MSINHSEQNCQDLTTILTSSLDEVFVASKVQSSTPHSTVELSVSLEKIPLLAALWPAGEGAKVVFTPAPDPGAPHLFKALQHWQRLLTVNQRWHLITVELSEQERTGEISTQLTLAYHYLLGAKPSTPQHFLVTLPGNAVVPARPAYQAATRTLQAGEAITQQALVAHLHEHGYRRHRQTIEPGSYRVRGEHVDVWHPTMPGPCTITLYGQTIENLTQYVDKRSHVIQKLLLPPVAFPDEQAPLSAALVDAVVFQSRQETFRGRQTVVYDAIESTLVFPWRTLPETLPKGKTYYVVYEHGERVREYLRDQGIENIHLCRNQLAELPVALMSATQVVVSEAALFPEPIVQKPVSYQQGLSLLADLRENRPAVHSDHGIGIYEGLLTRQIGGAEREYLVLRYAQGDSLSVPVEFAHKVTAYLGEGIPPLNRLGGTAWLKVRQKAREDAVKFAQELLAVARDREEKTGGSIPLDYALEEQLDSSFPYTLTPDQELAWQEVRADLTREEPMDRLIVGDVGFGKTEIAIRAARHMAAAGKQVAVLAPTTLLVQQHADTFRKRLPDLTDRLGTLSRFSTPAAAKKLRQEIATGEKDIIIGTHALLSKHTHWQDLGLVIIDEEQRFGVKQKEHFKQLRATVDILSLSATPIPRTLSMALSGLKQLSIISTPPRGRKVIVSRVARENDTLLQEAIAHELKRQGQVYVVAPLVRGLGSLAARVRQLAPQASVAVAHGQMDSKQLAHVMQQFDTGAIDILVCSSIIENGLDLPNANTLIVMQATRFGLGELYQLRGRVGRRERQGYAYFLYNHQDLTSIQRERLTALTEATRLGSGWTLAQRDLEIRGAGNLLGAEQSGSVNAIGVQLYLDMIHEAIQEAPTLTRRDIDIHLPLIAIIPSSYMADLHERIHYYQILSRAHTLKELDQQIAQIRAQFGPLPEELDNLYLLLQLQHVAAAWGITRITSSTIAPPDEDPYTRLSIDSQTVVELLRQLQPLGNWEVRGSSLTLDVQEIDTAFIQRLVATLNNT
ncbi:MAG: DEAD/DEAH box helicase [Candidatus Andersenbacteria bacterium]